MTRKNRIWFMLAVILLSLNVGLSDCQGITLSHLENMLRNEVRRWYGTPYQFAGRGKHGVDCSAFVMQVIQNLFSVTLPRYSGHQARIGKYVSMRHLRAGDLVFFRINNWNHVGLYLGNREFAHVSKSRGVRISYINNRYWRVHFWTARRIFR
jgi:cell wall-associated NlpC family hydrolase